ncbi:MAG TPA: glycosyltransferase, partial [Thermodesulfobacteriaceae bacterium]|nr:glycosyltransferase [Thermodesulfobacteriaceae bacterium]
SDIVVSATSFKAESFGKTAVEAQAMGKPVIASAHGGSLETVRDGVTGWLTEPEDADGMAEALREAILNEKLRKQRGENGRKWVRMNFTAARMCTETLKLYENMVS